MVWPGSCHRETKGILPCDLLRHQLSYNRERIRFTLDVSTTRIFWYEIHTGIHLQVLTPVQVRIPSNHQIRITNSYVAEHLNCIYTVKSNMLCNCDVCTEQTRISFFATSQGAPIGRFRDTDSPPLGYPDVHLGSLLINRLVTPNMATDQTINSRNRRYITVNVLS